MECREAPRKIHTAHEMHSAPYGCSSQKQQLISLFNPPKPAPRLPAIALCLLIKGFYPKISPAYPALHSYARFYCVYVLGAVGACGERTGNYVFLNINSIRRRVCLCVWVRMVYTTSSISWHPDSLSNIHTHSHAFSVQPSPSRTHSLFN